MAGPKGCGGSEGGGCRGGAGGGCDGARNPRIVNALASKPSSAAQYRVHAAAPLSSPMHSYTGAVACTQTEGSVLPAVARVKYPVHWPKAAPSSTCPA